MSKNPVNRTCLRCGVYFESQSAGNRICCYCKTREVARGKRLVMDSGYVYQRCRQETEKQKWSAPPVTAGRARHKCHLPATAGLCWRSYKDKHLP